MTLQWFVVHFHYLSEMFSVIKSVLKQKKNTLTLDEQFKAAEQLQIGTESSVMRQFNLPQQQSLTLSKIQG